MAKQSKKLRGFAISMRVEVFVYFINISGFVFVRIKG
jgi:hypothetical protein